MGKSRHSDELLKAKIIDAVNYVKKVNGIKFLPFLDPREQGVCRGLLEGKHEVQYSFWGGHEYCERNMLAIFPINEILHQEDWPISIFHLKPRYKDTPIRHSSVLGALIHLGIHRDRIGDIHITDSNIQFFISKELAHYINHNLNKISNISLDVCEVDWNQAIPFVPSYREVQITAASLRLDLMISKIYGISRKESSGKIKSGSIKINWEEQMNINILLKEQDVISIRGKGRAQIKEILGQTKKGNYRVLIYKYK